MKFPNRPNVYPIGIATLITSIHFQVGFLWTLHQINIPINPPMNPPWYDIPASPVNFFVTGSNGQKMSHGFFQYSPLVS